MAIINNWVQQLEQGQKAKTGIKKTVKGNAYYQHALNQQAIYNKHLPVPDALYQGDYNNLAIGQQAAVQGGLPPVVPSPFGQVNWNDLKFFPPEPEDPEWQPAPPPIKPALMPSEEGRRYKVINTGERVEKQTRVHYRFYCKTAELMVSPSFNTYIIKCGFNPVTDKADAYVDQWLDKDFHVSKEYYYD